MVQKNLSKFDAVFFVLLLFWVVIIWGPMLHFESVNYDDGAVIFQNSAVQTFNLKDLLWEPHTGLYHPLTSLSLATDYYLAQGQPWIFYLTSLIFHTLSGLLVYRITRKIFSELQFEQPLAALVSLIFLFHPLKIESVAWITERKDILSVFFALCALNAYVSRRSPDDNRSCFLSWFFYQCAMLSKVSVFLFPFVFLLIDWHKNSKIKVKDLIWQAGYLIPALPVLLYNIQLQAKHRLETNVDFAVIGQLLKQLSFYHEKSLFPFDLRLMYSSGQMANQQLALIGLAIFAAAAFLIWRNYPEDRKNFVLGYGLFFLLMAPVLKIFKFGDDNIVNDRYMYLPLTGLCFAYLPSLFRKLQSLSANNRRAVFFLTAMMPVGFSYLTSQQLESWRNSENLWKNVLKYEPESERANTNLAQVYVLSNRCDQALQYLSKGERTGLTYSFHAYCYYSMADKKKAFEILNDALKLLPTEPNLLNMYGGLLLQEQRYEDAGKILDFAIANLKVELELSLRSQIYLNRGLVYLGLGQYVEAERKMLDALALNQKDDRIFVNLGFLHLKQGHLEEAEKNYRSAVAINNQRAESHYGLGMVFARRDERAAARAEFVKALEANPAFAAATEGIKLLDSGKSFRE